MTREEAITVLKGLSDNPLFSDQHRAAFNIAIHDIKAHHDWDINNLILINKDNYEPLEQEPTTKNDLGVDCISRQAVKRILVEAKEFGSWDDSSQINRLDAIDNVDMLPSVTPQEPFNPMVEIDLYSVIKQKYIEREVLDKIRAEIQNGIHHFLDGEPIIEIKEVLQILDKYKAESEK